MNKKKLFSYLAALAVCFVIGCCAALLLRMLDERDANPTPLAEGQTLTFPGFSITVPPDAVSMDDPQTVLSAGDGILYAGHILWGDCALYLSCYVNKEGDALADYPDQALITQFTALGALEPRLRTLGGRRFIQYATTVERDAGSSRVNIFETWDANLHILFETGADAADVLPILATFAADP